MTEKAEDYRVKLITFTAYSTQQRFTNHINCVTTQRNSNHRLVRKFILSKVSVPILAAMIKLLVSWMVLTIEYGLL